MRGPFHGGTQPPRVSVVIVSHNTRDELLRCLDSLARDVGLPLEVLVVDNASADGSADAVRHGFPGARVIESGENVGFSRANNRGLRESRAPYVLILNSDVETKPGCIETLLSLLEGRPEVGIVGPRTLNADGTIQVSSGAHLTPPSEWRQRRLVRGVRERRPRALAEAERRQAREFEPDWVSAACLLARREALEAVGGFDEAFFLYEEDADLCRRVRQAGWRVVFTPRAEVVHHLGRSMARAGARPRLEYQRSHLLYYRKHNGPFLTLALRLYLLALASWGFLRATGPGEDRQARRQEALQLAFLVLPGA